MLLLLPQLARPAQVQPSQVQVARRFLLAVVQGEWDAAYAWLAPDVQQTLTPKQFKAAAQPMREQARRYGAFIDLYKLGYRLRGTATPEPFVAFSFKADTLQKPPHFQLDVTFRDSTARQVQGFSLVPLVGSK
ncbi:hypothetical protein [Hymenobacter tenuis]